MAIHTEPRVDLRLRENRHLRHQPPQHADTGALAGHEQDDDEFVLSDRELGIGEETEPQIVAPEPTAEERIAAVVADPVIAAGLQELIERRAAELAASASPNASAVAAPASNDFMAAMEVFADRIAGSLNRSTTATIEQLPGHIKPIPVEEVEARAAAFVEMNALIQDGQRRYYAFTDAGDHIKAQDEVPVYLLEEDFFNGEDMNLAGETVQWFLAPGVYMRPRNAIAKKISEAMWRYIGNEAGPSAEELAAQVSQMRRPMGLQGPIPEMPSAARGRGGLPRGRIADVERVDMTPSRINGTLVTENKGGFGRGPQSPRIAALGDGVPV